MLPNLTKLGASAKPGAVHIEGELRIVAEMAGVQPEALFSDVVARAGGISPALDDEAPVRDQLSHYGLRIGFRRPRGRRVIRAALAAVADLADHGRLGASHVEALNVLFRNTDPALLVLRPRPRPEVVAPIRERVRHDDKTGRYVRDDWTDHIAAEASAVGRLDAHGRIVLAEETWLRWLDWKMATETRVGVRSLCEETPRALTGDSDALDAKHRAGRVLGARCVAWSHQQVADYLNAEIDGPMLVIRQEAYRYDTPAPHWLAFNPAVARALGWQPSKEGLFRWQDASGAVTVESVWWEDGFVGHEPTLRDEEVGTGWLVVTTVEAWRQIVQLVGPTVDWVCVERSMQKGSPTRLVERTVSSSA